MIFTFSVNNEQIECREILVKEYKQLLKVIYGDEVNPYEFVDFITTLLSSISNKSKQWYKEIPITELFLCLLKLRTNTLGQTVLLNVSDDEGKKTLEFNLNLVEDDIKEINFEKVIEIGNVKITVKIPSAKKLLEHRTDEYTYYINSIIIDEKLIEIENQLQVSQLLELLPVKATLSIVEHFNNIVKIFESLNFLQYYQVKEHFTLGFIPTIENLVWYAKLFFDEPLDYFYDNIFYLAKHCNISPEYIENCTPGEYTYFRKKMEQVFAAQQSEPDNFNQNFSTEVDEANPFQ